MLHFIIHSAHDGQLESFQLEAIINNAAGCTVVCVSWCTFLLGLLQRVSLKSLGVWSLVIVEIGNSCNRITFYILAI